MAKKIDKLVDSITSDELTADEQKPVDESVPQEDLVVANVKSRYILNVGDAAKGVDEKKFVYAAGNVTMPRSHAEHWYSKNVGVEILGIPDNGTIHGHSAKARVLGSSKTLKNVLAELESLEKTLEDEDNKAIITQAADLVNDAAEKLDSIYAS